MGSTESLLSGLGLTNQSQLTEPPKGNISRMIEEEFMTNATMAGQHAASQPNYTYVYRSLILHNAERLLEVMVRNLTNRIIV